MHAVVNHHGSTLLPDGEEEEDNDGDDDGEEAGAESEDEGDKGCESLLEDTADADVNLPICHIRPDDEEDDDDSSPPGVDVGHRHPIPLYTDCTISVT